MEIEPHSTLKNRALGLYYKICIEVIKKRNILYYVDLFAGDGENICKATDNKLRFAPFITQFLEKAKGGKVNIVCFLNDLNHDNFIKLNKNINSYRKFITGITNEDANNVYKAILQKIPKYEWSIFFLDPYKYTELDFKTIEDISKHESYDSRSKCTRKPELIINLMTYTMQRNAKIDKTGVKKAIGEGDWLDSIDHKPEETKTYRLLHDSFIKNLENLGYFTTSIEIRQTPPLNSVLYYLIFASSIPLAHEIQERFKRDIIKYQSKWSKDNYRLKLISKVKKEGIKPLNDFFEQKN